MARFVLLGLILLAALLFQTTLLELVRFHIKPDLVLILVIFFALLNGIKPGAVFGAAAGLAQDLVGGRYLGLNALALAITALAVGYLESKVFKENLLVPILVVFLASVLHAVLIYSFHLLAGTHLPLAAGARIGIIEACFNALVVPLGYRKFLLSSTRGMLRGFKRRGV